MAQQKQPEQTQTEQTKGREMERAGKGEPAARRMPARWGGTPFSFMRRMMDDFERMIEEPLLGGTLMREPLARGPAIDVFERENQLVVRADVPGYQKNDIKLEVTEDGVLLEGERRDEREEKDGGYYRRERTYGSFRRLIPLPEGINTDSVRAEMKNGVLEVCFDLPEKRTERKRIEISEGARGQTEEKKSVH